MCGSTPLLFPTLRCWVLAWCHLVALWTDPCGMPGQVLSFPRHCSEWNLQAVDNSAEVRAVCAALPRPLVCRAVSPHSHQGWLVSVFMALDTWRGWSDNLLSFSICIQQRMMLKTLARVFDAFVDLLHWRVYLDPLSIFNCVILIVFLFCSFTMSLYILNAAPASVDFSSP